MKIIFIVIEDCINPMYISSHVLNFSNFLYIVHNACLIPSLREISMHMISNTTPTLNRLFPWIFPHCLCHSVLLGIWLSLHDIYEKWWLSPILPLLHLDFHLVFPSLLESRSSLLLIIKTLSIPYGFLQCLGVIMLYLVTDK
jgi:hypothetical protein